MPPRTSGWAIAALGTSLALFCPLLPIIGGLLAIRALVEIRANPQVVRGKGMALAALWLAIALSIAWVALGVWWNANVRQKLLHGPQAALRAGFNGDISTFKAQFTEAGATASDQSARTFIAALRERYGAFHSAGQDQFAAAPQQSGGRDVVVHYRLVFETEEVRAEVGLLLFARFLQPALESITVRDLARGDLTYP